MSLLFTSSLSLSLPSPSIQQERRLLASPRSRGQRIGGGEGGGGGISKSISHSSGIRNRNRIIAFFFNPATDPIVKEALKEPVAFLGGMFAGILRLDLNEEPLKEWVTRTAEAAGISEEETNAEESTTEAAPQEIEIE